MASWTEEKMRDTWQEVRKKFCDRIECNCCPISKNSLCKAGTELVFEEWDAIVDILKTEKV